MIDMNSESREPGKPVPLNFNSEKVDSRLNSNYCVMLKLHTRGYAHMQIGNSKCRIHLKNYLEFMMIEKSELHVVYQRLQFLEGNDICLCHFIGPPMITVLK